MVEALDSWFNITSATIAPTSWRLWQCCRGQLSVLADITSDYVNLTPPTNWYKTGNQISFQHPGYGHLKGFEIFM